MIALIIVLMTLVTIPLQYAAQAYCCQHTCTIKDFQEVSFLYKKVKYIACSRRFDQ